MYYLSRRNIIVSSILLVAAVIWISAYSAEVRLERQVEAYLMDQRQYSSEDIEYVKAGFGVDPLLKVEVHFENDPEARYYYYRDGDTITQYHATSRDGVDLHESYVYKHKEDEVEAKHLQPVWLAFQSTTP